MSLIDYDGSTIRVHALTQRVYRDRVDPEVLKTISEVAADALAEIWPEIENDPAQSSLLRANTTRLRDHSENALIHSGAHIVLFLQGRSLGSNGQVYEAVNHFRRLHQLCQDGLGSEHHDTFTARSDCASWQSSAGDEAGAVKAYEELLTDCLRILGPNHQITLATRANLAH